MQTNTLDKTVAAAVEFDALNKAEKERRSSDLKKLRSATVGAVQVEKPTVEINPGVTEIRQQLAKMMEQMKRIEKQVHTGQTVWRRTKLNCKRRVHNATTAKSLVTSKQIAASWLGRKSMGKGREV